jgi:ketosteroid isomerase-like protein
MSTETTAATRATLERIFSTLAERGFGEAFLDALSDDLVWTATGSSPVAGRYEGKSEYVSKVATRLRERLDDGPMRPIVEMILADGPWGCVRFRTEGVTGRNGADFSMQYCWMVKVDGDHISEVVGFYDTKKMNDLFV